MSDIMAHDAAGHTKLLRRVVVFP